MPSKGFSMTYLDIDLDHSQDQGREGVRGQDQGREEGVARGTCLGGHRGIAEWMIEKGATICRGLENACL